MVEAVKTAPLPLREAARGFTVWVFMSRYTLSGQMTILVFTTVNCFSPAVTVPTTWPSSRRFVPSTATSFPQAVRAVPLLPPPPGGEVRVAAGGEVLAFRQVSWLRLVRVVHAPHGKHFALVFGDIPLDLRQSHSPTLHAPRPFGRYCLRHQACASAIAS